MPGRNRGSIYSKEQTALWEGEVMVILAESQEAMSIDAIKQQSINLTNVTSQKMSRILGHLIDMGMVKKGKSKASGRMMYKSVAVMEAQGYAVDEKE